MSRSVRLWIILTLAYAASKLAVDLGVDGYLSDGLAGWLAVPVITAAQTAVIVAVTRRSRITGDGS